MKNNGVLVGGCGLKGNYKASMVINNDLFPVALSYKGGFMTSKH